MTSKEALEEIEDMLKEEFSGTSYYYDVLLKPIIKDLEVLEILKNSIYNTEVHKRVLSEPVGQKFMTVGLNINGDENIAKVKEWLDNE